MFGNTEMFSLNPKAQSLGEVEVNLSSLAANYTYLTTQLSRKEESLLPVVKADAYGHGLIPCAKVLLKAGAEQFAVGTVEEAVLLRKAGFACPLLALLGAGSADDIELAMENGITVLVGSFSQIKAISARVKGRKMQVALKFNTGMNRLGFTLDEIGELFLMLDKNPELAPVVLASHLASADEDDGIDFTHCQIAAFREIAQAIKGKFPKIKTSLYNSAGLLAYSKEYAADYARPGIALYGANPLFGTSLNRPEIDRALKPAMQVKAPILQVRKLCKGDRISYGGTFTADRDLVVAIVAAGYSQGYSRGMSNKSEMNINGRRCRVLGRICMQLAAVEIGSPSERAISVAEGDFAYLLGGKGNSPITVQELAAWWGSIPYELYCMLGAVNTRQYGGLI